MGSSAVLQKPTKKTCNNSKTINTLSFDVEDYFQVSNFDSFISYKNWGNFESRVERNTHTILEILSKFDTKSTFFILGWIANRFPKLVRDIVDEGHEVGTHGYQHRLIYKMTPAEFREDLKDSVMAIEQASGKKVLGHRAPSFSITRDSLWALDILKEEGLLYDSSIFPVRHPRYGMPNTPRSPYQIRPGFWEFPLTTLKIGNMNIPIAGGGYFRLYPYKFTRWGIEKLNKSKIPVNIYLHPWEFDPGQPRLKASFQARFRHYNNLDKTKIRLLKLCKAFNFVPIREYMEFENSKPFEGFKNCRYIE